MRMRKWISGTILSSLMVLPTTLMAERGSDGELRMIFWQAPSLMNPYLSGGIKEKIASSIVLEPLARINPKAEMLPRLAQVIPSVENGGISPDLKTVTWKLRGDILWSDGSAFTAEDVAFTASYCMEPSTGCAQLGSFTNIESVDAVDAQTVKITFKQPEANPFNLFVGASTPILQKAQFENCIGKKALQCTEANFFPIGTGAFRLTDFMPNDVLKMEANPYYREADKPAFSGLVMKGGGDAVSAARTVLETGEMDYAINTQVAPEVLERLSKGSQGEPVIAFGPMIEQITLNLTDPSPDLDPDTRSTRKKANPVLSDLNVRKALSLAIDRNVLVDIGYGRTGKPACNVLESPEIFRSPNNDGCVQQQLDAARALLDQAGWVPGPDGVRAKDGQRLELLFQAPTNPVRQDFQVLIKQWWSEIGVDTELRNINASVFFGGDVSSPDTLRKFYADVQIFTNGFTGIDPETYLNALRCGAEPRPETHWKGTNVPRFCSEEYDTLLDTLRQTASPSARQEIFKKLNDIIIQSYIVLPLIHRSQISARANTLEGVRMNPWGSELWNIADWRRAN
ncbi:peptide ABC transporter substrate-binding protein [Rhodobacteraceae bacterium F11138]|nr:peptide ABC transporter substrate-binding protein [Rhodobacteraceae bacterium F11138]